MLNFIILLIATFFLNGLSAIQVTTEFFPEEQIPAKYFVPHNGNLTLIKLEEWPVDSTINVVEKKLTSAKPTQRGVLSSLNGNVPPTLAIYSLGYVPGEPVKFTFVDTMHNLIEEVTIIPSPLYVNSSIDNAKIQATLDQISPPIYLITFTGFQKDEVLLMKSSSHHESFEDEISCDNTGTILYMPQVLGKKGGWAKVSYKRSNGEVLHLELPWGLEWLKYNLYKDKGKVKSIIEDKKFLKENPEIAKYFKDKEAKK